MVNASGSILNTYGYHAFGDFYAPQTAGTTPNNYLYTGQQYDSLTGNYSLRARHYDPSVGGFLSRDKYQYNLQNPFELNRYGYTANNPANYSDPSGYSISFDRVSIDGQKFEIAQSMGPVGQLTGTWWGSMIAGGLAGLVGYVLGLAIYYEFDGYTVQKEFDPYLAFKYTALGAAIGGANFLVMEMIKTPLIALGVDRFGNLIVSSWGQRWGYTFLTIVPWLGGSSSIAWIGWMLDYNNITTLPEIAILPPDKESSLSLMIYLAGNVLSMVPGIPPWLSVLVTTVGNTIGTLTSQ